MYVEPQYMRDWQRYEESGHWPDAVYTPTEEDLQDPDHDEIAALVVERYAVENRATRERRLESENRALRAVLEANGIEWDGDGL